MRGITRRGMLEGAGALAAGLPAAAGGAAGPDPGPERGSSRLWYAEPAAAWTEALPVGNGRIGAMVFGGVARERLQLNDDSFWTGGPYDPVNPAARATLPEVRRLIEARKFAEAEALADARLIGTPRTQMAYQNVGELRIELAGGESADEYRRELDLETAIATTWFRAGATRYVREALASAADDVIAVRLSADAPFEMAVTLASAHGGPCRAGADGALMLTGRNAARAGVAGALRLCVRARIDPGEGRIIAGEGRLRVVGTRSVTLLLAIATSYRGFDDVDGDPEGATAATIAAARRHGFDRLRARSVAAHRALYNRVALDLGTSAAAALPTDRRIAANRPDRDPALAALYFNYARYLLIASSRPGTQPANLQGLWNDSDDPPWQSKYTVNINTQMNYWPAEVAALPECTEPLIRMVRELAQTGAGTARTMYGARGWVCHHNTDLWRATAPIDGAQWGMWPMGGAWLCTHLWERYDYGRDLGYLRSVYPVMRGAAEFFLDTLSPDPASGALLTSPSISPENRHPFGASICAGPAMDRQILRDLFDQVARAAGILKTDRAFAAELSRARARLAPDRIGAEGQLQEWHEDWDAQAPERDHRHVSHLYALFPGNAIDPDRTPELAAAARRSLQQRGDESTGWATAWRANLWARLRDGERAWRILAFLLGPGRTYPNLFDAHPPFQIDGNFGGARAIAELLVQARGDDILLLPALPAAWPDGSIRGLRTPGQCRLDLHWRNGKLVEAVFVAGMAGQRRVRLGGTSREVSLRRGEPVRLTGETFARG